MKRMLLVVIVTLLVLLAAFVQPTQPASAITYLSGSASVGCTSIITSVLAFNLDRNTTLASAPGSETVLFRVFDGAGTTLLYSEGTLTLGGWNSNGTIPYTTLPQYNPITFQLGSKAQNSFAEQVVYTVSGDCAGLPTAPSGVFSGRGIPGNFVLRTIVCDTPVYAAPGGAPAGDNRFTAGQTWFVNPEANEGWTEVFVPGAGNVYIPTRCVGGYPANAPAGGK